MHRLIPNHDCRYDIFTKTIPQGPGSSLRQGIHFEKTKAEPPETIANLISHDIVAAVREERLPILKAIVKVDRDRVTPLIVVTIEECSRQLVARNVDDDYDCSRFLDFHEPCLNVLGNKVWANIARIMWSYNSDLTGGRTKFLYSIKLCTVEMMRQLENFDHTYSASQFEKKLCEISPEIYA